MESIQGSLNLLSIHSKDPSTFWKGYLKKRKDVTAGQVVGCGIAPLLSNDN